MVEPNVHFVVKNSRVLMPSNFVRMAMTCGVLGCTLIGGALVGWAQSCPASSGTGEYSTEQNEGACETVCGINTEACYKVRCFTCSTPGFVYHQACYDTLSGGGSACEGC
jgi:hypothetical protein